MRPNGTDNTAACPSPPFTMATNNKKKTELTAEQRKQVISNLLLQLEMEGNELNMKAARFAATREGKKDFLEILFSWRCRCRRG